MRMAELLAQQPVLSGAVVFGVCVCGRVSTRVVQTCAVTCHRPFTTYPSPLPTLEERGGRVLWGQSKGFLSKDSLYYAGDKRGFARLFF